LRRDRELEACAVLCASLSLPLQIRSACVYVFFFFFPLLSSPPSSSSARVVGHDRPTTRPPPAPSPARPLSRAVPARDEARDESPTGGKVSRMTRCSLIKCSPGFSVRFPRARARDFRAGATSPRARTHACGRVSPPLLVTRSFAAELPRAGSRAITFVPRPARDPRSIYHTAMVAAVSIVSSGSARSPLWFIVVARGGNRGGGFTQSDERGRP